MADEEARNVPLEDEELDQELGELLGAFGAINHIANEVAIQNDNDLDGWATPFQTEDAFPEAEDVVARHGAFRCIALMPPLLGNTIKSTMKDALECMFSPYIIKRLANKARKKDDPPGTLYLTDYKLLLSVLFVAIMTTLAARGQQLTSQQFDQHLASALNDLRRTLLNQEPAEGPENEEGGGARALE